MDTPHTTTVYARREPTTDPIVLSELANRQKVISENKYPGDHSIPSYVIALEALRDVQVYRDAACTRKFARFGCDDSHKPDRRHKYVTLNCFRYALAWVPDLPG